VLLAVALSHVLLVGGMTLSPWLGGGFGMFSTTDSSTSRHVHVWRPDGAGGRTPVVVPADLDEAMRHLRVLPTTAAIVRAGRLLQRHPDIGGAALTVEVWRTRYDPLTMAPSSQVLRSAVVPSASSRVGS
jgi:hypothetical protein